ncbi:DUF1697 domain-containing protein [Pelagibacterium xiamenense]|uniref:DUF1697 domain-containing protein n=1 Tax=Pelagibacterium xiamenense TaxID=2901140 RepID=UPI001E45EDFA|nr:DUF1697 domain-containing protein [Pelagibacterium xiamenense]
MTRYVALLYSIVLGEGKRLTMAPLREMFAELGYSSAETLLATGNVIFESAEADPRAIEARLETAFAGRFGKAVAFIVRSDADWQRLAEGNPLPEASAASPAQVAVRVMRAPVSKDARALLEARVRPGESLRFVDGDIWVHIPDGISTSALASVMTNARIGVGTSRNWNTVRKIAERLV